jgi:hypothetical protein
MTTAIPEPKRPAEQVSGMIERVTFFNQESGLITVVRERAKNHREVTPERFQHPRAAWQRMGREAEERQLGFVSREASGARH